MKNSILKFLSSVILLALDILLLFSINIINFPIIFQNITIFGLLGMCIIKFLIVMILEPDSLWEIIKKFIYILIFILLVLGVFIPNIYIIVIGSFILVLDTLIEFNRFQNNVRKN